MYEADDEESMDEAGEDMLVVADSLNEAGEEVLVVADSVDEAAREEVPVVADSMDDEAGEEDSMDEADEDLTPWTRPVSKCPRLPTPLTTRPTRKC
ncbi:hypothetical protein E2562_029613 [Oryza meyeriana var. granulata]|uniref:Uncharacterized protein n=1 Tax=Oryza meyeriana var. granulata TaxID=110450 RepID=A0A6G1E4S7_9ORYZ|nr:hypothetical protein E2562_029613 [Oryza meyeriana var. granulata]